MAVSFDYEVCVEFTVVKRGNFSKTLFMATSFMLKLGRYWPWKTVSSHLNLMY